MIISISGAPGSGKTTVAKILCERLKFKYYYMGSLRREMARKRGMTLQEYNKLGETDPSTDLEVDHYQADLGKKEDDFVIQGRTSFHFIPHSVKVYLDVDPDEGARRVWKDLQESDDRNEGNFSSLAALKRGLQERIASDVKRYGKYYKINVYDHAHYDLVIDTTGKDPNDVASEIITFASKVNARRNKRKSL